MKPVIGVWLVLIVAAASGCAAKNPIVVWQERLAEYVKEKGNGDPNVLRDTVDLHSRRSPRPGRITFTALGIAGPGVFPFTATFDAQGVLVGLGDVGSRHWFLFLVGIVKQYPRVSAGLEDVRLLAFTADRAGLHCRVGGPDQGALARYVAAVRKRECSSAVRASGPVFPSPADLFQLKIVDQTALVTESQSGATWKLQLGNQERRPGGHGTADRQKATTAPKTQPIKSGLPKNNDRR